MDIPVDKCIVKFGTSQVVQFKALLDVIKDLITECALRFDKDGFKIITLDPSHVGMIHLSINQLEEYHCTEPINAGVFLSYLYKVLRSGTSNHHLHGYILKDDVNAIYFTLEQTEKRTHISHRIDLLNLKVDEITVPDVDFDLVLSMPSSEFQRHIKELSHVSNVVTVRVVENSLELIGVGDHGRAVIRVDPTPGGLNWIHKDPVISKYEESFYVKFLEKFSRGGVDPTVQIFLRESFPFILRFQLAFGSLRFCVAPIRT